MTKNQENLFVETSLGLPNRPAYLRHGDKVPPGVFPDHTIERLLKKGVIVRVAPGDAKPAVPAAGGNVIKKGDKRQPNTERDLSRWAFPDEMLDGRNLDQLNMLAIDHCKQYGLPEIAAFESVEIARAFLQHEMDG